jgi:hypothetical protein
MPLSQNFFQVVLLFTLIFTMLIVLREVPYSCSVVGVVEPMPEPELQLCLVEPEPISELDLGPDPT